MTLHHFHVVHFAAKTSLQAKCFGIILTAQSLLEVILTSS